MNKTLKQAVKLISTDYKHVLEFGVYPEVEDERKIVKILK
jgi:hypothetical protein